MPLLHSGGLHLHRVLLVNTMRKLLVLILLSIFLVGCDGCPEGQKSYYQLTCADGVFYGEGGCPLSACDCYQYCQ